MAETVRTEAVTVLPEYQETFLKDLLASTSAIAGQPTSIPGYQVAGMTPLQQQAIQLGSGIGAYQPMMEAGAQTLQQGVTQLGPQGYQQYQNPFLDDVLGQGLQDLQRQADIERQRIGSAAIRSGAFGGSRQAVAEQELQRKIVRNKRVSCLVNSDYNKRQWVNQRRRHKVETFLCSRNLAAWNNSNSKPNWKHSVQPTLNGSLSRISVLDLCQISSVAFHPQPVH